MTTTTVAQLWSSLPAEMKKTLLVILLSMTASSLLLGCQGQTEKDAAAEAKSDLDLTIIKQFRDLNNQQHELIVGTAEKLYGSQVAQTLVLCYEDGYDMVQGEDHKFTSDPKLGPRYIAKCDKITKEVKQAVDKFNREHEKETSQ